MTGAPPPAAAAGAGAGAVAWPVRTAHFAELDTATLYDILRLRVAVFVVEQQCPYPELDGRDSEPETVHAWVEDGRAIVGCLRVLQEASGETRIGRVAVAQHTRRQGIAQALVQHALAAVSTPVVADVQAHLVGWYARFGFTVDGEEYVEDGIPHVRMRLGGGAASSR